MEFCVVLNPFTFLERLVITSVAIPKSAQVATSLSIVTCRFVRNAFDEVVYIWKNLFK